MEARYKKNAGTSAALQQPSSRNPTPLGGGETCNVLPIATEAEVAIAPLSSERPAKDRERAKMQGWKTKFTTFRNG
ncbi:MAG: hypothetical protein LBI39_03215 [Puniceicoccales bacterium]|nr:hypothetical protein [Puniceicoccales bacterium]